MVSDIKTWILNCLMFFLWSYLVAASNFSCLAKLAKLYLLSGQTNCATILINSIASQIVHMKCLWLSMGQHLCWF